MRNGKRNLFCTSLPARIVLSPKEGYARRLPSLAGVICFLILAPVHASTIIGNLPAANDSSSTQIGYNSVGTITATSVKALAFTMGTNNFNLTSAVLRLECGTVPNANCSDLQSISLGIYSNGASQPGSLLGSFTYAFSLPLTTSWASYTFTPATALTLTQGGTYWLVLNDVINPQETNDALSWSGASPNVTPTGSGATYAGVRISSDNGATWGSASVINNFELDGTNLGGSLTPEPATFALIGLGMAGIGVLRRHRSFALIARQPVAVDHLAVLSSFRR